MAPAVGTLLERDAELEALEAALDEVHAGRGGLVVVEGPAGIGKTRLLGAGASSALERSMLVFAARGSELERGFAFGIVRQLFEPHVAHVSGEERARLLRGTARPAETILGAPASNLLTPESDPYLAGLHALYWLTSNLSERSPLLLAIDDLHWADAPSMRFLGFLVRRLEELPVLLLLTARTAEAGAEPDLLVPLLSDPRAERLRPAPLSQAAALRLTRAELATEADEEFCIACHRASGGNPFLLSELLTELRSGGLAPSAANAARVAGLGAAGISRAVLARLSRLQDEATELAQAVAILGDNAELRDCARMAGLETAIAGEMADSLAQAEILSPGRPLSFAHPVLRAAIADGLTASERTAGHTQAARILAEAGAAPDRIATHLLAVEAGADPWVLETLLAAAAIAAQRGAPDAVVLYLERAVRESPPDSVRPSILRDLGLAGLAVGNTDAIGRLREALEVLENPDELVRVTRALALGLLVQARAREAVEVLAGTIARIASSERDLALELEADLAAHAELNPEVRQIGEARLERYGPIVGSSPGERLARAALAFQQARRAGSAAEAAELAESGLGDGRLLTDGGAEVSGPFYNLLIMLISADRLELAQSCLDPVLSQGRMRGSPFAIGTAMMWRSTVAYRRGAIADAEGEARAALDVWELFPSHQGPSFVSFMLAFWVDALIELAQLDTALDALQRRAVPAEIPPVTPYQPLLRSRGRLRIARGDTRAGLEDLLEYGRREENGGLSNPLAREYRSEAALALAALGEEERAKSLAEEDLERARRWGTSRGIGMALRALGLLDERGAGLESLREAVAVLETSPARLDLARALTDLGAVLRRANRRTDAREPLRRGLEIAHECRASALAERAHGELVAAGARPRRILRSGPDSLTPSERRISAMAAEGMSNAEIAGSLFLSSKTVEMHLSNAYRKLGIGSRTQLPVALAAEPDDRPVLSA